MSHLGRTHCATGLPVLHLLQYPAICFSRGYSGQKTSCPMGTVVHRDAVARGFCAGLASPGRLSTRLLWQRSSFGQPNLTLASETSHLPQPTVPSSWGEVPCGGVAARGAALGSELGLRCASHRGPFALQARPHRDSCAPAPGSGGNGRPAASPLPSLCLPVTQQPHQGEQQWLHFHSLPGCRSPGYSVAGTRWEARQLLVPGLPLASPRGQGLGRTPRTSQGGDTPEFSREEEQAAACLLLALGPGLLEQLLPPPAPSSQRAINTFKHTLHCGGPQMQRCPSSPMFNSFLRKANPGRATQPQKGQCVQRRPHLDHRRDPAHTATHPCLQRGFWETDTGLGCELQADKPQRPFTSKGRAQHRQQTLSCSHAKTSHFQSAPKPTLCLLGPRSQTPAEHAGCWHMRQPCQGTAPSPARIPPALPHSCESPASRYPQGQEVPWKSCQ